MILYETKYLTLKVAKREGKPDWVYAVRANAKNIVVILPLIKTAGFEDEIVFLVTKRPPLFEEHAADFCLEIPAGLVGDENKDETMEEALKKELLEETGLAADGFKICAKKISSSGGLTSETSTIALAIITNKTLKQTPIDDGGVIVDRVYVKKSNVRNFIKECENKGWAISGQALSALFLAEEKINL